MTNMYETLSNNLVRLRKSRGYTQAELALILKYSDKSVSKWETGEALPSLETLLAISDLYNVSVDDLLRTDVSTDQNNQEEKIRRINKTMISVLSIVGVWLIATLIFVLMIIVPEGAIHYGNKEHAWLAFIFAMPISSLLGIVFSAVWRPRYVYLFVSLLTWTLLCTIHLSLWQIKAIEHLGLIYIIGGVIQLIIVLCRSLRRDVIEAVVNFQARRKEKRMERKIAKKEAKEKKRQASLSEQE